SLSTSPCSAKNASARCFRSRRTNAEISGGVYSLSPRPIRTTPPASPLTRNGKCSASCRTSSRPLPMNRLIEYAVRCASVSRRRCASRPTRIAPSSPTETTDGTRASPPASRITTGTPSFTYATSEFVVPRSMPTTLLMMPNRSRVQLAFDAREQVVDVVALQDALAKGIEHGAALARGATGLDERIPSRRQIAQLRFVGGALRFDWRPRSLEPRLPRNRGGAGGALLANLVELLVEREHLLEQRRRHRLRGFLRRPKPESFGVEEVLDARHRILERPIRVVQIRRTLEAGAALGRRRVVEVVRVELAAQIAEATFEGRRIDIQLSWEAE